MQRSIENLADRQFDVLVIGAGIYGACIARDAALRGLSVALVERDDFGAHTSHNSLKLIHGGLRYIQHLDFKRMRESVCERRAWMRIAPHLTRPLKFVMHTHGVTTRGPLALWVAGRIHEAIGYDRNQGVDDKHQIPRSEVYGREIAAELMPDLPDAKYNGAASWYDGQVLDADRLLIECLKSAVEAGAVIANYAEVTSLKTHAKTVTGATVRDGLSGEQVNVKASLTVNSCGPWSDQLELGVTQQNAKLLPHQPLTINMNIVVGRPIIEDHAIGVRSHQKSDSRIDSANRQFFVTPWRGMTAIGTLHEPFDGDVGDAGISASVLEAFVNDVNAAYPSAEIGIDDIVYCYWGLTPGEHGLTRGDARRARHGQIIDHSKESGVDGVISVIGVKWTTARLEAERVVDLALAKLGVEAGRSAAAVTALPGARGFESERSTDSVNEILESGPSDWSR